MGLELLLFVPMEIVDHYGHHGGMNILYMTTRTGRQRLRSEVALRLALRCVFLQTLFGKTLATRTE